MRISIALVVLSLCLGSAQAQEQPEVFLQLGHSHGVYSLAYSPDATVLASGAGDSIVLLWDLANAREIRALPGHLSATSMVYSPDGHLLALATVDGRAFAASQILTVLSKSAVAMSCSSGEKRAA
jgi:WD40 repeat protein